MNLDLSRSKVTLVQWSRLEDLDKFLSDLNHIKIDNLNLDFAQLRRDLWLDVAVDESEPIKWIYVDVDNIEVFNTSKPEQRGNHKLVAINEFVSKFSFDKNFRLILGYSSERFEHGMIYRVNLSLHLKEGGLVEKKYSTFSVYNFKF